MATKTKPSRAKSAAKKRASRSGRMSGPALAAAALKLMKGATVQTRMTEEQKSVIQKAAEHRRMAVSEYIRLMVVEQARREVEANEHNVYDLTADEQLELWELINAPVKLTAKQKKMGRIMRGEE